MRSIFNTGFILCLFIGYLFFNACDPDNEKMRIERFEFLDSHAFSRQEGKVEDTIMIGIAYLLHGYSKSKEHEADDFINNYFCDSILHELPMNIPNLYVHFFKHSNNTNRNNFQKGRIKHKILKAKTYDHLLYFSVHQLRDSFFVTRQKLIKSGMALDPAQEDFNCE